MQVSHKSLRQESYKREKNINSNFNENDKINLEKFVKILEQNLKKVKFDINDMLEEIRSAGYFDLSQVEYAVLEPNGEVSILPKPEYRPLTPKDMKIKKFLNDILQDELGPIRERREMYSKDLDKVYEILKEGTEKARIHAAETLNEVRNAMKINYFEEN